MATLDGVRRNSCLLSRVLHGLRSRRWRVRAGPGRLALLGLLASLVAVAVSYASASRGQVGWETSLAGARQVDAVEPQWAVQPLHPAQLRNASAVTKAIRFILDLQPAGTYILSTPGTDDVVHMDVAHSAIALTKTRHLAEAEAAMDWLLGRMTVPGDPDEFGSYSAGGKSYQVDYAGSWWDHFRSSGEPRTDLTRGRAEGVGIALIATYTIYLEDPGYLSHRLGAYSVADRVAFAARYLASPAIQREDGRFNHRPDYRVSFNEEGARMVLGLQLASEMLDGVGRTREAKEVESHAELGLSALLGGKGLSQGMAYDYYALGIWGLATPQYARQELRAVKAAGLATPYGVRNWDWQFHQATSLLDRFRWWAQAQTIAPSETFDWAIASITAGQIGNALEVESRWLALQLPDGGFPGSYLPVVGLSFGPPASYSAARFVMLERMLTEVLGSGGELASS